MTTLTPSVFSFNSHEVRTIHKNNVVWFVASDIAKTLEYRNASDLTRVLDSDERDTHIVRTPSGDQDMLIINESGLYHALFKSRKKEAQVFRKWVTNEVLPAIRKTGTYSVLINAEQQQQIKQAVNERAFRSGETHQGVYHKLYTHFKIPRYQELPSAKFDDAMKFLGANKSDPIYNANSEQIYTIHLTDSELCSLAWLWKASEYMRSRVEEMEQPLRLLRSDLAGTYHSMGVEYKRVIGRTKIILERETREINPHPVRLNDANWRLALEALRS